MKQTISALSLLILLTLSVQSQITPLYLNFNSHSEENDFGFGKNYNNNVDTFNKYRNLLVAMCDTLSNKGARYNSQHDWAFLDGVKLYDNGTPATNNKNIFQWMRDDNNGLIELDCHAHKTQKNDADVAWYYQQIGITPSNVVGGFLYDTVMNANIPGSNWTDMQDSIPGKVKPFFKWKFDILWGGGSANHLSDLNPVGIWKPDTMHNILSNNNNRHLILLGNGCNELLTDTATGIVNTIVSQVRELVYEINNGQLPAGKFYSSCIQFNVRDLKPGLPGKAAQIIDSLQPLIDAGYIVWKNHTQKVAVWQSQYASAPNISTCDDVPVWNGNTGTVNAIEETATDETTFSLYPNPVSESLSIICKDALVNAEVNVFDMSGRKVLSQLVYNHITPVDVSELNAGIYFIQINSAIRKFVKQ